jgi:hypothetical protein
MNQSRKSSWGKLIIMNAVVSGWLIYTIAAPGEEPRAALAILQYVLLALSLIGLIGSLYKFLSVR